MKIFEVVQKENILAHFGPLSYEEIGFLLNRMSAYVDKQGMSITVKKKVYSAMVESLENIYKHQDIISSNTEFQPKFTLFLDDKEFSLFASNSILNSKAPPLREKLNRVNSLNKEGLKELYKLTILSGDVSPKGGAGLGIINIAKVSENKIHFKFEPINGDYSYFTINVIISC